MLANNPLVSGNQNMQEQMRQMLPQLMQQVQNATSFFFEELFKNGAISLFLDAEPCHVASYDESASTTSYHANPTSHGSFA